MTYQVEIDVNEILLLRGLKSCESMFTCPVLEPSKVQKGRASAISPLALSTLDFSRVLVLDLVLPSASILE
jgi:hypothetical protein